MNKGLYVETVFTDWMCRIIC